MHTKKQIAEAAAKFIGADLVDAVESPRTRFALSMAKKSLLKNPHIISGFLDSPMVAGVIGEKDGEYDVDLFAKTLKAFLGECDSYYITIPGIPMFAPEESKIRITAEDVDKVLSYLKAEPAASPAQV